MKNIKLTIFTLALMASGMLLVKHASADTINIYSSTADSHLESSDGGTWNTVHDSTSEYNYDSTTGAEASSMNDSSLYYIGRTILPFDTSVLPYNATINSASLYIYVTGTGNGDNDGDDWITVVEGQPGDSTSIVSADYDNVGDAVDNPTEGIDSGDRKDLSTDFTTSAYNSFNLNSTGIGWIDKSGWTDLGLREGHDVIDSAISTGGGWTINRVQFSSADQTGTSQDPYLSIDYTLPIKEFVAVVDPDNGPNTDFTSLSAWEAATQVDLTDLGTLVYSISDSNGWFPVGGNVTGVTSGATASSTYISSSSQILLYNIQGNFQSGEVVQLDDATSNNVTLSDYGYGVVVVASCLSSAGSADTTTVDINGWTTDSDNYIVVRGDPGDPHGGRWNTQAYRLSTSQNYSGSLNVNEEYARIENLQIENTYNSSEYGMGLEYCDNGGDVDELYVTGCLFRATGDGTQNSNHIGLGADEATACDSTITIYTYNNIFFGWETGQEHESGGSAIAHIYNNTYSDNDNYGLLATAYSGTPTTYIKNNLAAGNTNDIGIDFTAGTWYIGNNLSSDGTADDDGGSDNLVNQTINFVSSSTGDFHLRVDDFPARRVGTSSVDEYVTHDIDGEYRTSDIGADEVVYYAYRSVGNTTDDLKTTGSTVTIDYSFGTSTATLSTGQPDNVGVGDVIQYGGAGYWEVAFITGRISSTTYRVQAEWGILPTATTSAACNIYRAYLELSNWEANNESNVNSAIDSSVDQRIPVNADLVATNSRMYVPCYADGEDNNIVTMAGWTTGTSTYIKIYTPTEENEVGASQRHDGTSKSGYYMNTSSGELLNIRQAYVRLEGLELISSDTAQELMYFRLDLGEGGSDCVLHISDNLIHGGTAAPLYGIRQTSCQESTYIHNNILYNVADNASTEAIQISSGNAFIYNNTIISENTAGRGIHQQGGGSITAKNNLVNVGGNDFSGTFLASSTNNISADSTSASSTADTTSTECEYWDVLNNDYHLSPEDTACIDTGADLSSDIAHVPGTDFDGDIYGEYDVGADNASVYFEPSIMESDGTFSSLSAWETAVQCDLTATNTLVFDIDSSAGWIPTHSSVYGTSSNVYASSTVVSTSSNQILLYNIDGTLSSGEWVCLEGATANCVRLANAGNPAIATAKIDGTWSSADTQSASINGWTTDKDNYVYIYTTETARHRGKWENTRYRISVTGLGTQTGLYLQEDYTQVAGLQIEHYSTNGSSNGIYFGTANTDNVIIDSFIIKSDSGDNGGTNSYGITFNLNSDGTTASINNTIIYKQINYGIWTDGYANGTEVSIYNATVYNCTNTGIYEDTDGSAEISIYNSAVFSNGDDFNADTSVYSCASDDGDGENAVAPSNWANVFEDHTNYDFHLKSSDTELRNSGTSTYDLSSYTYYDVDNTSRGAAIDIGADEVPLEFVSTICEAYDSGGDCANLDYHTLNDWEDAVESNIASSATRVFSGYLTGTLDEDDSVTLVYTGFATTSVSATVVATSSDQILLDFISGTTTPVTAASGTKWCDTTTVCANYWTIQGSIMTDDLGASPRLFAKIDGAWTATDTTKVLIDSSVTSHDNYIKIYTTSDARHNGIWSYTDYRLGTDDYDESMRINDKDVWLDGLQVENYRQIADGSAAGVYFSPNFDNSTYIINNSIVRNTSVRGGYTGNKGIELAIPNIDGNTWKVYNNIVYDYYSNYRLWDQGSNGDNNTFIFVNNTSYNDNTHGFELSLYGTNDSLYLYNNIAQDSGTDYTFNSSATNYYHDANISEDSSSPDTSFRTTLVTFIASSSGDFHLDLTDTAARDQGVDFTGSSTLYITDDIDANPRPYNGAWDIGADEYAQAVIYRSVGPNNTSPLRCGSSTNSFSISGSTATFSGGLPANSGVGDVIVYNSSSTVVFIHGRTSNYSYTVADADGSSPDTAATNETDWCVYRAYTTIYDTEEGDENNGLPNAVENFDDWASRDLVSNREQWNVACYADAVDVYSINFSGWTTDSNYYLRLYTPYLESEVGRSQRHKGKWDNNAFILRDNNVAVIDIRIDGMRIEGLQVDNIGVSGNNQGGIFFSGISGSDVDIRISDNIIRGRPQSGSDYQYYEGIQVYNNTGSGDVYIYNNIIYGFRESTTASENNNCIGWWYSNDNLNGYIYNNTVYGCENGIANYSTSPRAIAKNNISQNNNRLDYYGFANFHSNSGNNISSDNSAPGMDSQTDIFIKFWDEPGRDYHLHPDDSSGAIDGGTSSVSSIVTEDIDHHLIHVYDIGADDASHYFAPTIKETGGEFSTLVDWEAAVQGDLTATTSLVFNIDSSAGWIPIGSTVYGTSSFAFASSTIVSTSSNQILLYNISSSTFQNAEWVCLEGATNNCVRLSNAGNPAIAQAKIDGSWNNAESLASTFTVEGWETGKYNYIHIYTTNKARHNGKWNDTKYRLIRNGDVLSMNEGYYVVDGLQIDIAPTSAGTYREALVHSFGNRYTPKEIKFSNNIIKQTNITTNNSAIMMYGYGTYTGEYIKKEIIGNIVYDFSGDSGVCIFGNRNELSDTTNIFNNTIYNCWEGIGTNSGSPLLINNIIQICISECISNTSYYGFTNITSDGTAIGATSFSSTTVSFVDATARDFHLSESDQAAIGSGTVLWNHATSSFVTDIDGTARGATWDIGADEISTEFVSTVCENTSAGGDCDEMDYNSLYDWEDAVESDIASSVTRVFGGYITGKLNENDAVTLIFPNYATTTVTATVVATTSDQILIDWITGTSTPVVAPSSSRWWLDDSNYWNIGGTGEALGASPIITAKIDGSWSASDTRAVDIDGWTTDNDNYIKIYTTDIARHNGVWDYDKYRLAGGIDNYCMQVSENYARIDGLQINNTNTSYDKGIVFEGGGEMQISNNIIRGDTGCTSGCRGIFLDNMSDGIVKIWNNIIYDWHEDQIYYQYLSNVTNSVQIYVYNNTIFGGGNHGMNLLEGSTDYLYLVNNIVQENTGGDYNLSNFVSHIYNNISSDGSATGINAQTNTDVDFIATSSDNFLLAFIDTSAKDQGLDITSSSTLNVISSINTDIQGDDRPFNEIWDIGADEFSQATIYRSVGPNNTSPLQCGAGTNNLNVTNGVATTTTGTGLADNIGVGDAIVYNSSSSIMFIESRTSSTTYGVQNSSGVAPDDVTNDADWCIFRAYTSLANAEAGTTNTNISVSFDTWSGGRDLVANREQWNIACYADAIDTTRMEIDNWTTSADYYLRIFVPDTSSEVGTRQRHQGRWDKSKYALVTTAPGNSDSTIEIFDNFVRIEGLQIHITNDGNQYSGGIATNNIDADNEIHILDNFIRGTITLYDNYGITTYDGDENLIVANNIVVDFDYTDSACIRGNSNSQYFYNNTVYNCYEGFWASTAIARNNLAMKCGNNCYRIQGWLSGSGNNGSEDGTVDDDSNMVDSVISTEFKFWDVLDYDFHLHPDDAYAIDAGTSSVSAILSQDIDGKPIHTYDIGADDASVEFKPKVMETGGEFSGLSAWETAVQGDLTATTSMVFDIDASTGWIPIGSTVFGTSSYAFASSTIVSTSSNQILLYNVASSTFQSGEWVCLEGATANCVRLADAGNYPIAVAKIDGSWSNPDTVNMEINGWTPAKYNYIKVYTTESARHSGKWNENKYRLQGVYLGFLIDAEEDYVHIEGLQIMNTRTVSASALDLESASYAYGNIVRGNTNSSSGSGINMSWLSPGEPTFVISNIVYDMPNEGIEVNGSTGDAYIFNNTVSNCNIGIAADEWFDLTIAKNNIAVNNNTDYAYVDFFGMGTSNNISSDTTATGTNSVTSASVQFVDSSNDDFHLSPDDTVALNSGVNLFNFASSSYDFDIEGTARGNAWDIGADEVPLEFESIVCENYDSGGECSNLDYQTIGDWEDAVESDITATGTRIFSGAITGTLNEDDTFTLVFPNFATTSITGTVVATTSDQILVDNIKGTSTPMVCVTGSMLYVTSGNYWSVSGSGDALGASPIAIAKIDGSWNASDTQLYLSGDFESDYDNYIKVYTTNLARHPGKWDYTKYRIVSDGIAVAAYERFVVLDGLQLEQNDSTDNRMGIQIIQDGGYTISNNIIRETGTGTSYDGILVQAGGYDSYIYNNIIYNFERDGIYSINDSSSTHYVYNNTVYNCSYGIQSSNNDRVIAINNIVASTTDPFNDTFLAGTDYNATDINDSPSGGANNYHRVNQSFNFVSTTTGSEDFHLVVADTSARDWGMDFSASSSLNVIANITADIDGHTRPYGTGASSTLWDIGADEYTINAIYRSVGPSNTSPLVCGAGSNSLTINSSQLTLNSGLPDDVGVGDAVVYNSSSSIAFIHARTDSTSYTVKNSRGNAPTAISADTGWCIFRAYTSLSNAEAGTENTGLPDNMQYFENWSGGKNLLSSQEQWNIACYADAVEDVTDGGLDISGWNTSEENYIKIYTPVNSDEVGISQRHSGKWDDNKYNYYIHRTGGNAQAIDIVEANIIIDGLQINVGGNGDYRYGIYSDNNNNITVSNNIIKDSSNLYYGGGIHITQADNTKIYNNIIYDFASSTSISIQAGGSSGQQYIYNNTVYNCGRYGIESSYGGAVIKNNIVQNCGTYAFYCSSNQVCGPLSDNNISDDWTAPGTNSLSTTTVIFADYANDDFHLSPKDTAAENAGSSSPITLFGTDIDGELRPTTRAFGAEGILWDIGADEIFTPKTLIDPNSSGKLQLNTPTTGYLKTSALTAHWTFNGQDMDMSSTTAEILDRSGGENYADIHGAVPVPGTIGQALKFDGVDDYVSINTDAANFIDMTQGSISLWYRADGADNGQILFEYSETGDQLIINFPTDTVVRLYHRGDYDSDSNVINVTVNNIETDTEWHHVLAIWDDNGGAETMVIYYDGVKYTDNDNLTDPAAYSGNVAIGSNDDGDANWFKGYIDEVRVYNVVLSSDEANQLYRMGQRRMQIRQP